MQFYKRDRGRTELSRDCLLVTINKSLGMLFILSEDLTGKSCKTDTALDFQLLNGSFSAALTSPIPSQLQVWGKGQGSIVGRQHFPPAQRAACPPRILPWSAGKRRKFQAWGRDTLTKNQITCETTSGPGMQA